MKTSILFLLFLTACLTETPVGQINSLEKKLQSAESTKQKTDLEITTLTDQIRRAKLALIRKRVDEFQTKQPRAEPSTLFLTEREALYEMIQHGAYVAEAQVELDRILRLITQLSDR